MIDMLQTKVVFRSRFMVGCAGLTSVLCAIFSIFYAVTLRSTAFAIQNCAELGAIAGAVMLPGLSRLEIDADRLLAVNLFSVATVPRAAVIKFVDTPQFAILCANGGRVTSTVYGFSPALQWLGRPQAPKKVMDYLETWRCGPGASDHSQQQYYDVRPRWEILPLICAPSAVFTLAGLAIHVLIRG